MNIYVRIAPHLLVNSLVFGIAAYEFGLWVCVPLLVVYFNGLVQGLTGYFTTGN